MVYLDPKNDITFRKVFGQHPSVMISFLNALLPLPADGKVTDIEYLNPELLPDITVLKNTIVDIRCRDASGRQFLVEMQMLWTDHFESRILFNACKAFSHQIGKGEPYNLLAPVYSLNIINQSFSSQQAVWYHHYRLSHQSLPGNFLSGIEFVSIELPNFKADNYTGRKVTALWLRFLKEIKNRSNMIPQELMEVPEIAEAVEALKEASYSEAELQQYERYWDVLRTQQTFISDALRRGEIKGKIEGKTEGKTEGKIEGKIEEKQALALKLIHRGFSNTDIHDLTGLALDAIEALRG
jgi:predicted transposase/invertase (TIGR01784 family)